MLQRSSDTTDGQLNPYRGLPAVHELAEAPEFARRTDGVPRESIMVACRRAIAACRKEIADGDGTWTRDRIIDRALAELDRDRTTGLPAVINGTGILIHTGLGRAPLSARAIEAMVAAARGYTALEIDLATGERGQRIDVVRRQFCELTGAESATVVNNNAAALLITLAALAKEREVIVSRGELIEIGGGFRLPDVMKTSGAKLIEVGTTNKTRIDDYAAAISDDSAMLLKVHTSNFRLHGFTESVDIRELAALGARKNLPVVYDVGSGALLKLATVALIGEPYVQDAIAAGADVVLFSGDKLLGGPQAGVISGRRKLIDVIQQHPLARALRVDKLTLAALSATLAAYRHPQQALAEIPLWQMAAAPLESLQARGAAMIGELAARLRGYEFDQISTTAYMGGGALPEQSLPSLAICIRSDQISDEEIAARLRRGTPPIIGRLEKGRLLIDLRTVLPWQDETLVEAIGALTDT